MSEGLSVIVCIFNGRDRVPRFIAPLRDVLTQLDFPAELVIVDDGSTDGTADAVRALGDDVRLVEHDRNRSLAVARNTGILAARHEWLMFCDDDLEIDAEAFNGLWRLRDRRVCLVPELRDPEGLLQNAATSEWRRGDLKLRHRREPVPEPAYPVGAAIFVNAQALRDSGGFDERFQIYYDDTDAGFALRRSGVAIRMAEGVAVVHHWHGAADFSDEKQARISRRVYDGRWRFAMTALTGWRRAVALALGLPRTGIHSLRKRTLAPLRGYFSAMRDLPRMLEPRSRHDLNSRLGRASLSTVPGTYDQSYYEMLQEGTRRSARVILPHIMELLSPRSAVDLGCGSGGWLATFSELGGEDILGVDGPWIDASTLQIPPDRFEVADLAAGFTSPRRFDLAMSLEVAEHLPEAAAEPLVESLVALAPAVLFSAAVPGQGGTDHVNERWQADWASRFERRGYTAIDAVRPVHWNDGSVEWWYLQNTLLYVDATVAEEPAVEAVHRETAGMPLSVVHPRMLGYAVAQERSRGVRRVARRARRYLKRRG